MDTKQPGSQQNPGGDSPLPKDLPCYAWRRGLGYRRLPVGSGSLTIGDPHVLLTIFLRGSERLESARQARYEICERYDLRTTCRFCSRFEAAAIEPEEMKVP